MKQLIQQKLKDIESKYDIKILYACESGSRAWGFPSPDSDYDVRFIYVHKMDWYLTLRDKKDTNNLPIDEIRNTVENKLSMNGAYRFYTNPTSYVQGGIQASFSTFNSRYSQLSQWDNNDPLKGDINTFIIRTGFGFTYKTAKYHLSLSLPDFVSYDMNNDLANEKGNRYMRRNYFLTCGAKFEITEYLTFKPSALIRYYDIRAVNFTINAGAELNQTVLIGISYAQPNIYGLYGKVSLTPRV